MNPKMLQMLIRLGKKEKAVKKFQWKTLDCKMVKSLKVKIAKALQTLALQTVMNLRERVLILTILLQLVHYNAQSEILLLATYKTHFLSTVKTKILKLSNQIPREPLAQVVLRKVER